MSTSKFSRKQRGITMVETLVALLVLSIGMLGIAALYVETMRANRTAMTRGQAINLVQDMSDRIRANARAQDAYDMSNYGGNPATKGCVTTQVCTDTALAEDDLAWWKQAVLAQLPGGPTAQLTVIKSGSASVPDRYNIQVTWKEPGAAAPVDYSYQTNLELLQVTP